MVSKSWRKCWKKNDLIKQPYYINNINSKIAEDERTYVEHKHDKATCIPPYFKQIAAESVLLATGMACFRISSTLLPFVGSGIVGIGVSKCYNGLSKPNDELRIVLEEIKEDSSIQCTISWNKISHDRNCLIHFSSFIIFYWVLFNLNVFNLIWTWETLSRFTYIVLDNRAREGWEKLCHIFPLIHNIMFSYMNKYLLYKHRKVKATLLGLIMLSNITVYVLNVYTRMKVGCIQTKL